MIDKTKLDKVDNYLLKFTTDVAYSTVSNSRYYRMSGKVIRVSDHIGNTSDGVYHIIVKPNGYLIHHPNTGTINIVTYEQVKEFIRVFQLFPVANIGTCEFFKTTETLDIDKKMEDNSIFGINSSYFTEGQLHSIKTIVKKVKEENRKKGIRL